jgi:Tfp pilus assembly protein PilF
MTRSRSYQLVLSAALSAVVALPGCASAPTSEKKKEPTATERAQMLVEIANGSLTEGDATGALETLMRAEKEDSSLPELHHSKALAYYFKKDLTSAIEEARKAVELKPNYSDANNTLGKLLVDTGKGREAVPYLEKAANDPINREAFKPLTLLGMMSYREGQYGKAEGYLSRAIEAAPTGACVAYSYRGHLRLRESRFREAVKDYDSAGKRMCASFVDAHMAMGIAYERSKQYDLARKKYLEIQDRYPNTQFADQAMNHLRSLP